MAFMGAMKEADSVYVFLETPCVYDTATATNEANLGVWKPKGNKHVVLGCAKDLYKAQVLQDLHNLISPREEKLGITKEYLLHSVVGKIVNEYQRLGVIDKGELQGENYGLIIACGDKCYYMGGTFTIREIDNLEIFNYANPFFKAAFDELGDLPLLDKLKITVAKYEEFINPIHFPIIVKNTMSNRTIFITREEAYKACETYLKGGSN